MPLGSVATDLPPMGAAVVPWTGRRQHRGGGGGRDRHRSATEDRRRSAAEDAHDDLVHILIRFMDNMDEQTSQLQRQLHNTMDQFAVTLRELRNHVDRK